jgi:hypothetical protein
MRINTAGAPTDGAGEVTVEALLELSGEDSPAAATTLVARSLGLVEVGAAFARFISLEVLSLSDNQLTSLAGCGSMPQLSSLNINMNRITSLAPLAQCRQLTHLFASNNKVSSISPLAACQKLCTLSLFQNQIPSLDSALDTLSRLPVLAELDLASNPCSLGPPYRHRIVSTLSSLRAFDGAAFFVSPSHSTSATCQSIHLHQSNRAKSPMHKSGHAATIRPFKPSHRCVPLVGSGGARALPARRAWAQEVTHSSPTATGGSPLHQAHACRRIPAITPG